MRHQLHRLFFAHILIALLAAAIVGGCSPEAKKSRLLKRAEDYFNSGQYNKAKIEYLGLLRLDPQNATAFERLGVIWLEQGAPLRAAPFFLKARELSPKNLNNKIRLARTILALGDPVAARKEATTILAELPDNEEAIVLLAETNRTKEDIAYTEQQLQKFRDHNKPSYHLALANLAFQKADLRAAQIALQRAVELDPQSATPHLALATLHILAKDPTRAGEELKKAADLPPVRSMAKVRLAEFKVQNGATDEAKQILSEFTSKTPDFLPAWILRGKIAFSEKHYDEAFSFLENALSQDPENIEARMLHAQVWLGKGEIRKATEGLSQLSKAYPNVPAIKYQLALVYLQQNSVSEATDALKQAVALNPEYVEAILLLAQLNLRNGNPQAVVPAMTELLKKRPDLGPARVVLAEAHQLLGRLDDATAVLQEQVSKAPQDSKSYFLLGLVFRQQNKNDEARKAFEKAQELAPDNLATVDQLVELDVASKDLNSAMAKAQRELTRAPKSAPVQFIAAKVYTAMKAWDQAEATLLKALELDPNFSRAYDALISVYVAQGKLPEAISRLENLLAKNPQNAPALATSAMLYEQTKDFEKARNAYEKLLATQPDFVPALNNLAYLYANRFKQLDKALELANKARQLQPDDGSVADTLGWLSYKKGDYPRALSLLQQSAAKLPENPEVQFHLGMANYMMGQIEPAKKALQQAANAPTDFPEKEDCKRRLALLQEDNAGPGGVSIEEMKRLLAQEPNDLITLQRIGESYEKQGKFAEAAAAYEQVVKLNPHLIATTIKLAQLNAGPLKNGNKAMTFAKQARELSPTDPKVNALLGSIAYQAGNFEWSYSLLQESTRRLPDDVDALRSYAWAAYSLGKVNEARQAMQNVLKSARESRQIEDAKSFLSMTSLDESTHDLAAFNPADVDRILQAEPDNVPALMAQAAIAKQRHDGKAAVEIYNRVLQRYPDFTPAQKNLAVLYADDPASLGKAYDLGVKVRKKLPDDIGVAQTLAEISYKRKDFDYALQLLNESARKRPLDARGLFYLGMSSLQLKQNAQARGALQRALNAGLVEPFSTEAKRALTQLR